jgi:hypothetical protein
MRTGIRALVAISIGMALVASAAHADPDASAISDSELDARLAFLEERLDGGETYAKVWQWGWTSGYSLGIVYGTAKSITVDTNRRRVTHIVTAVKSTIGTTRLLVWRHPGRNGADEMRAIEGDSREAKEARLAKGEQVLEAVARRAEQRWDWRAHAGNVALNLAGAGFIFGFGKDADAWESLGVGIGVGTAQILTAPKRGIQDLADYETRFGMRSASRVSWTIVPTAGGAAFMLTF